MDDSTPCVLHYPCIEQTAEIFHNLRYLPVITATANRSSELAPFRLAWQFFAHSDRHALISYNLSLTVVLTLKYTVRVTISMREIVGGVVRYRDLVTKIKIAKFFSWRARVCW